MNHKIWTNPAFALFTACLPFVFANAVSAAPNAAPSDEMARYFVAPPEGARPWVYWYFMDGNLSREGIHADLEAMKKAGIGGAIYLEVGIGIPRGPVGFMSPKWQELFGYAVSESKRLGLQIALGTGPGWAGSGGPWVKPELSMQHLVASETSVSGPVRFDAVLPRPKPRAPFFGEGTLRGDLRDKWLDFYRDETVLAFPTPKSAARIDDTDHKALYYRAPYSSQEGTPPRIPAPAEFPLAAAGQAIAADQMVVLSSKMGSDGCLTWDVPAGNWTILRFGRTPTGQTTRPAPDPGIGFESDKFSAAALDEHLAAYAGTLIQSLGPNYRSGDSGLTMLHFDSWEMGAQNWSPAFRQEFLKRRGYDAVRFLPAMLGYVVDSPQVSERFLWDLRQTASELVQENHALRLKKYAHARGLSFAVEPYDMNPTADLDLGAIADLPMGEFWSRGYGFKSEYSCFEAVSVAHTNGRRIVGAESFTSDGGDAWLQHPANMKNQLDWALCAGINKFVIHRYQHQPDITQFPGMTMGPYGVHWERTQTWWDMVPAFHAYISRSSEVLRQGLAVADILYLTPEGAPQVFTPPASALTSGLPDRRGYNFDGCSPKTLIERATVKNNRIIFPDGMSYSLLVLPHWDTMTPALLRKITQLVKDGATIQGNPPRQSPSLVGYPNSDAEVKTLATALWGAAPTSAARKVGKGRVIPAPVASGPQKVPLGDAKWIWLSEANPATEAPVATRYFRTNLEIAPNQTVQTAVATVTADNRFELSINGRSTGSGGDFHNLEEFDIASFLKPGSNEIRVVAVNEGASANPAGLLASISLSFAGGGKKAWNSGGSWQAAAPNGPWSSALELGPIGMAPWSLKNPNDAPPEIYPDYAVTASVLKQMNIAPDFESGAPMRSIHRRLMDGDVYFIANSSARAIETTATFRTAGKQPQWWNPVTGEMRDLSQFSVAQGRTRLPVRLAAHESGFVVFRKPIKNSLPSSNNFPNYQTLKVLSQPWNVAFDPKRGGPANIKFEKLDDWSQRPEMGIKYYSGKAVYTTSFDKSAGKTQALTNYSLSLGTVKNLATVRLNGRDLGVVWCNPWRVDVPAALLKPTGNRLEVTVANLWTNRLIGDAGKPRAEQLATTTFNPLNTDSPLQPSGLIGPVTLDIAMQ